MIARRNFIWLLNAFIKPPVRFNYLILLSNFLTGHLLWNTWLGFSLLSLFKASTARKIGREVPCDSSTEGVPSCWQISNRNDLLSRGLCNFCTVWMILSVEINLSSWWYLNGTTQCTRLEVEGKTIFRMRSSEFDNETGSKPWRQKVTSWEI